MKCEKSPYFAKIQGEATLSNKTAIYITIYIAYTWSIASGQWAPDLFRVNTEITRKQAARDNDCPWSIASDKWANVYTAWEDKREPGENLNIYFRKRNVDGSWEIFDEKISAESDSTQYLYGHPSICVLADTGNPKLLVCYVKAQ